MLVAVGSNAKGAPGVTTLATVMAMSWPGQKLLLELDARGADLPYRLMLGNGQYMAPTPSVSTLAVAARPGAILEDLRAYSQMTSLHVPVIHGEVSTRASAKLTPHLPAVAEAAASWPGTVIADLGSLQPNSPTLPVTKAATVVVLVTRADTEGLGHLRGRIEDLTGYVGTSVGVVVACDERDEKSALERVRTLLYKMGSPATVLGSFVWDSEAATRLWSAQWGRRMTRSALVRSAGDVVKSLFSGWPEQMRSTAFPAQPAAQQQMAAHPWQTQESVQAIQGGTR